MVLQSGETLIGRYRIAGALGGASSRAVFRAFDSLRDRECVLEELRLDAGGGAYGPGAGACMAPLR